MHASGSQCVSGRASGLRHPLPFVLSEFLKSCSQAKDAAQPSRGKAKGSKHAAAAKRSTHSAQHGKGAKQKQPEGDDRLVALADAAEALPVPDPASDGSHSPRAQQPGRAEESPPGSGKRLRSYMCAECQKRHRGHCGTDRAVKTCLRRGSSPAAAAAREEALAAAAAAAADGPCKECRRRHMGGCGTDRAGRACLRRAQPEAEPAQAEGPAAASAAAAAAAAAPQQQAQPSPHADCRQAAEEPQEKLQPMKHGTQSRTLGIAAKLQALAQRPGLNVQSAAPARDQPPLAQKPRAPSKTRGSVSLKALQQAKPAETSSAEQKGPSSQPGSKQRKGKSLSKAGKNTGTSVLGSLSISALSNASKRSKRRKLDASELVEDLPAGSQATEEAAQHASDPKRAAKKGSRKASQAAQSSQGVADGMACQRTSSASEAVGSRDTSQDAGIAPKRKHGRPSKLRRLTKAGSGPAAVEACSFCLSLCLLYQGCVQVTSCTSSLRHVRVCSAQCLSVIGVPGVLCAPQLRNSGLFLGGSNAGGC